MQNVDMEEGPQLSWESQCDPQPRKVQEPPEQSQTQTSIFLFVARIIPVQHGKKDCIILIRNSG